MPAYHVRLATIQLPGTTWVASEVPGGTAFALREDLHEVGGDPSWASFCVILTEIVGPPGVPLSDIAESLMRRRIPQGDPDRFETTIAGCPALGFEYTDGVSLLRTHFCTAPGGVNVEITFRSTFLPSGDTAEPLAEVAEVLLSSVRWR